jgi:hypothetical protein
MRDMIAKGSAEKVSGRETQGVWRKDVSRKVTLTLTVTVSE